MKQAIKKISMIKRDPNPSIQPLLALYFSDGTSWHVDVGGKTERFVNLNGVEIFSRSGGIRLRLDQKTTPLMKRLAAQLADNMGKTITRIGDYIGSAGPSHIYRGGALFERVDQYETQKVESGNKPTPKRWWNLPAKKSKEVV